VASAFTHAVAATAIGTCVMRSPRRWPILAIGALAAVAPDADVVAFRFGIPYEHMLGHRGLSHSIVVAACVGGLAAWWASWRGWPRIDVARLAAFFFLATASHGLLDAMTDGGLGVACLAPFSSARWFFPWRPIRVSPLSVGGFFSTRGLAVIERGDGRVAPRGGARRGGARAGAPVASARRIVRVTQRVK
jgi:inner membrane protein